MSNNYAESLRIEEYRALKSEMLLRIAIQNITLFTTVMLFIPAALLIVIHPNLAGLIALAYATANLSLAMQWCHQGIRQCNLKQAVLARDKAAERQDSWEEWLPDQRPKNLLGSRWFVSTKLVFIGLSTGSITLSLKDLGLANIFATIVLIITITALLTNPKE